MLVLAEHMAGNPYAGWWAGLVISFGVVVVVVAVVAALLLYASRIGDGAGEALDALESAHEGITPLARLGDASGAARAALAGARSARASLERTG
ncbi:MAG: hypothetical protein WKF33_12200 [Thermoleophilaceae bacterium]